MNKVVNFNFFPYHWTQTDEPDEKGILTSMIRAYGWNENNDSVYCCINDFNPFFWIELPEEIEWTETKISLLCNHLKTLNKSDGLKPVTISYVNRHKLYYANIQKININGKVSYQNKKYPFIQVSFRSQEALNRFSYVCKRPINHPSLGKISLKPHCFEASITPILKLFAAQNIPSSNWINCSGVLVPEDERESTRKYEYIVSFRTMIGLSTEEQTKLPIVYPTILSFDNEAYSNVETAMPKAEKPTDKVFMIAATVVSSKENKKLTKKYLLYLNEKSNYPLKHIEEVEVRNFKNEGDLYVGLTDLIKETDPDVVMGYNIFGWDIKYMYDRSTTLLNNLSEFDMMGCIYGKHSPLKNISWESSAYGKQDLNFFEAEGRLFIDLLPLIKRNYKLSNYRLETVCDEFLKTNKDPIKPKDIFKAWREKDIDLLTSVGKYAVQDTYVVVLLYEKLLVWFDLIESATTNCVPIFYMYTKGQQIKMYSSLLKFCYHNNFVVQSNAYEVKDDESYEGAYVSQPKAGIYKLILPFDFASLYPSIIQAYNIDYTKLVTDESIPDELCHVFAYSRHVSCEHDKAYMEKYAKKKEREKNKKEREKLKLDKANKKSGNVVEFEEDESDDEVKLGTKEDEKRVCASYRYRFLKADVNGKGIIPTLLEDLLKARKDTRKIIAKNEDKIDELKKIFNPQTEEEIKKLEAMNQVLDKRQLSYKVSANSMYGAMGVKKGYLPLLPGAMCVTYRGRTAIQEASAFLEKECGGNVIYNDTDSAYTYFNCLEGKSMKEVWEYAEEVVEKVKKLFPPPMKLEFEGKAYIKFLILTKKRYCAIAADENGNISNKLVKRGIVLQRRDNCKFLRQLYEKCIYNLLDNIDGFTKLSKEMRKQEILKVPEVQNLLGMIFDMTNELFQRKYNYKDFVITKALTRTEYKGKSIPAHAFLAQKMMSRGIEVPVGSRLEYLLLDTGNGYNKKEKQQEQIEDSNYFVEHRDVLRLNYIEYFKRQCQLPVDELLRVAVRIEDVMKEQLSLRICKNNYIQDIKKMFSANITFQD